MLMCLKANVKSFGFSLNVLKYLVKMLFVLFTTGLGHKKAFSKRTNLGGRSVRTDDSEQSAL